MGGREGGWVGGGGGAVAPPGKFGQEAAHKAELGGVLDHCWQAIVRMVVRTTRANIGRDKDSACEPRPRFLKPCVPTYTGVARHWQP